MTKAVTTQIFLFESASLIGYSPEHATYLVSGLGAFPDGVLSFAGALNPHAKYTQGLDFCKFMLMETGLNSGLEGNKAADLTARGYSHRETWFKPLHFSTPSSTGND